MTKNLSFRPEQADAFAFRSRSCGIVGLRSGGISPTHLWFHPGTPLASRPRPNHQFTNIHQAPFRPSTFAKRLTPVAHKNSQLAPSNQNGHAPYLRARLLVRPAPAAPPNPHLPALFRRSLLSLCAVFQTYFSSYQQLPHSFALSGGWGGTSHELIKGRHEPHHD
jgi:hypothetical protein